MRGKKDWQMIGSLDQTVQNCLRAEIRVLEDETKIAEFAEKFCVKMEYTRDSIKHLTNLKFAGEIRAKKRAGDTDRRKEKSVHQ